MKFRPRRFLTNPFTLVLPLVLIVVIGWRQYTYAGLALSEPSRQRNMLSNGDFHDLSDSVPAGWQLSASGSLAYTVGHSVGYVSGNNVDVYVSQYTSGDLMFVSPKVSLHAQQTYLFKGYYKSSTPFALLARYYDAHGHSKLVFLREYSDSSGGWSTVSDAFNASSTITAVRYEYRVASVGLLRVNGVYLEPKQDMYVAPVFVGTNRIPNPTLVNAAQTDMPDLWTPYRVGSNTASFSYDSDSVGRYLTATLAAYKNGEAKWQYPPQPVEAHQHYQFSVQYKSRVPTTVQTEYVMQDGSRQFDTTATLMPADDWTQVTEAIEVPPDAVNMMVTVVLTQPGTLSTRNYTLANSTKSGPVTWRRPLVSITFDDGWQSAYTAGAPILNRYGLTATFYINPSSIETPGFMTASELTRLSSQGDEIAAHGYAHDDLVVLNDAALAYQLREGRDYLRQAGYRVTDAATPYGDSDAEVQWYARHYFQTLRSTETGLNTRQNFDAYNLKVLYVDTSVQSYDVAAALRQAKQDNGWLILVYHRVGRDTTQPSSLKVEDTTVTLPAFIAQMQQLKDSSMTVMPVRAAFAEVTRQ